MHVPAPRNSSPDHVAVPEPGGVPSGHARASDAGAARVAGEGLPAPLAGAVALVVEGDPLQRLQGLHALEVLAGAAFTDGLQAARDAGVSWVVLSAATGYESGAATHLRCQRAARDLGPIQARHRLWADELVARPDAQLVTTP